MAFLKGDQSTHPGDGVAHGSKQPIGVAEGGLKQERQKGKGKGWLEMGGHAR